MTEDKKVKKLGMKDVQREGWEYELTVSLNLDRDSHTATASKDRTEVFEKMDPFVITEKTGELIRKWCESGVEPPKPVTVDEAIRLVNKAKTIDKLKEIKATLTPDVLKDDKFTTAAIEQFNKLNNKQPV